MKTLSILVVSLVSLVSSVAVAAEPSKPAKECGPGQVKVLVAKAALVNEDGTIRVISRSICVKG